MENLNLIDKLLDKERKGYTQNGVISFVAATCYSLLFSQLFAYYKKHTKNAKTLHLTVLVILTLLGIFNLLFAFIFICSPDPNMSVISHIYYTINMLISIIVYTLMRICYYGLSFNKEKISLSKVFDFLVPPLFFAYSQFTLIVPIGVYMGNTFRFISLGFHALSTITLIALIFKTNSQLLEDLEREQYFSITKLGVNLQEFMGSFSAPIIAYWLGLMVELAVMALYFFNQIYYPWILNMIISLVHLVQVIMISWCIYIPLISAPGNENARPPDNVQVITGDGLVA